MWVFWVVGMPRPSVQFAVHDRTGSCAAPATGAGPAPDCLGEFDGKVKYGRLLRPGQNPGDVVFAEKRREDELRELTGFGMLRLIWRDYDRPRTIKDRFERLARRSRAEPCSTGPSSIM